MEPNTPNVLEARWRILGDHCYVLAVQNETGKPGKIMILMLLRFDPCSGGAVLMLMMISLTVRCGTGMLSREQT